MSYNTSKPPRPEHPAKAAIVITERRIVELAELLVDRPDEARVYLAALRGRVLELRQQRLALAQYFPNGRNKRPRPNASQ